MGDTFDDRALELILLLLAAYRTGRFIQFSLDDILQKGA